MVFSMVARKARIVQGCSGAAKAMDGREWPPTALMVAETRIKRYFTITATLALAFATLLLAWPRFLASYRYLPVDIAIERYLTTREIPSGRLDALIKFANQAIAHQDNYQYHNGLSMLHLLRALDLNTPAMERLSAYRAAEAEALASIEQAPAQPAVWLRIANIRWILHDEPADILAPWKMSIFTGRTDYTLITQRIEIGLAHREFMDKEAVSMFRDQLLLGWRMQPGSVIQALAGRDRTLTVTKALIQNTDPTALEEMEAWLAKLP